jgi:peptide/nickel transport system permease protein
MLEVIRNDYIVTARAKGLRERTVVLRHALRNALIPIITLIALSIPGLISGAVITESVFSWPGMGRLIFDSLMNNDYSLAMGIFLLFAVMVVFFNLVADIVYTIVDPRITYD